MEWTSLTASTTTLIATCSIFYYYYKHYVTNPVKLHSKYSSKFSTLLHKILPILKGIVFYIDHH